VSAVCYRAHSWPPPAGRRPTLLVREFLRKPALRLASVTANRGALLPRRRPVIKRMIRARWHLRALLVSRNCPIAKRKPVGFPVHDCAGSFFLPSALLRADTRHEGVEDLVVSLVHLDVRQGLAAIGVKSQRISVL